MIADRAEIKKEAERLGLTNLTDEHLSQFADAKASAELLTGGVPRDLHMYEEPAHTFHANKETE